MADKDIDKPKGEASARPEGAPESVPSETVKAEAADAKPVEARNDLPMVESPPLSPAEVEPAPVPRADALMIDPVEEPRPPAADAEAPSRAAPAVEPPTIEAPALAAETAAATAETPTPALRPRFTVNARARRNTLLAASVALAAAFGAVLGTLATGGFAKPPQVDIAGLEERKAMQQSLQHLAQEVTTLKGHLETANKSAQTQLAKMSDKLSERLQRESAEITGSIAAPQTAAAASSPAPEPAVAPAAAIEAPQTVTPLPPPRPAAQLAALQTSPRVSVVSGWTIRDVRDGYVYVQGRGDIFQVVPGAPLPGLGPVEAIKRQGGRWVVVTPKGLIVGARDRRYFDTY